MTVAEFEEEIIGDYKIVPSYIPGRGSVRKALGPLIRNWSWISFYDGPVEMCRDYIRWAERIDAGDQNLIEHLIASDLGSSPPRESQRLFVAEHAHHFPKMVGYNFAEAISLFPAPPSKAEVAPEVLLIIFIAIPVLLICGFLYHSM